MQSTLQRHNTHCGKRHMLFTTRTHATSNLNDINMLFVLQSLVSFARKKRLKYKYILNTLMELWVVL